MKKVSKRVVHVTVQNDRHPGGNEIDDKRKSVLDTEDTQELCGD